MRRLCLFLVGLVLLATLWPAGSHPTAASAPALLQLASAADRGYYPPYPPVRGAASTDYDIVDGHYYPQPGGSNVSLGYSITNDDGIPFWDEYRRLGGPDVLGYPISQRFLWDGFVTQAMQKIVFQWRPEVKRVYFVNVFDDLHQAGKDDFLAKERSTPFPLPASFDEGLSWAEVVQARLALLDDNPALKEAYLAAPEPIFYYGLPTSRVEFSVDHYSIRLQRAVIQQWTVDVPWAKAGEVTIANGGDLAKEAGLWPAPALAAIVAPPPPPEVVAAPGLPDQAVLGAQRVAVKAFPAVVKLSAPGVGAGTGVIFDRRGYVITNYHVLGESSRVRVTLADGQRVEGTILGSDPWSDLAVIKLEGEDWPALPLGDTSSFGAGEQVVALGYSPSLPGSPSVTTGLVSSLIGSGEPGAGSQLIYTTAPIFPGYSGGPLLNMKGEIVGIDTALIMGDGPSTPNQGLSISIASAHPVVDDLLANGSQRVPWLGFIPYTITPELRRLNDLVAEKGVVIVSIFNDSPAARAGLRKGDAIVAAQGQPIEKVGDLLNVLGQVPAGGDVDLEVVDLAGGQHWLSVAVLDRPSLQTAGAR